MNITQPVRLTAFEMSYVFFALQQPAGVHPFLPMSNRPALNRFAAYSHGHTRACSAASHIVISLPRG